MHVGETASRVQLFNNLEEAQREISACVVGSSARARLTGDGSGYDADAVARARVVIAF